MPPRSGATAGSPSLPATPRAPFFLPRGRVPFVAIRVFRERLLFVGDETEVVLGLHRFDDLADERPTVFLRRLLKEILDVLPKDRHPRLLNTRRQSWRFDGCLRQQFQ